MSEFQAEIIEILKWLTIFAGVVSAAWCIDKIFGEK